MRAVRILNTNRKITSQTVYRNLEFGRRITVGEKTKCNAQVDDTLTKVKGCTHPVRKCTDLELQLLETGDIHGLSHSMSQIHHMIIPCPDLAVVSKPVPVKESVRMFKKHGD